jgi:hypothetical protein
METATLLTSMVKAPQYQNNRMQSAKADLPARVARQFQWLNITATLTVAIDVTINTPGTPTNADLVNNE